MEKNRMIENFSLTEINALLDFLIPFITEERKNKFDSVIHNRLKSVNVVLEDVYQSHNTSAILRTCDLVGIQDIHFIENKNHYKIAEDVALGASQWLSIKRHSSTEQCLADLKKKGYKIVATSPHESGFTPLNLPIDYPITIVLGTEKNGISPIVKHHADYFLKIPMYGFTESYNVSVSAGICLHQLTERMRLSNTEFSFGDLEKKKIYVNWLLESIPKSEILVKEFKKNNKFAS